MAENWVKVADAFGGVSRVNKLVSFEGSLFGINGGGGGNGTLLKWTGSTWTQVAGPLFSDTALLHSFNGNLLTIGSGKIYKWDEISAWVEVTTTPVVGTGFSGLTDFDGNIYAGPDKLYESVGGTAEFTEVAPIAGGSLDPRYDKLIAFYGNLYMGTVVGELFVWTGSAWLLKAPTNPVGSVITDMAVYKDELYALEQSEGKLLKWDGVSTWVIVNPGESARESSSLVVFGEGLYRGASGTGGSGLWKFDDVDTFTQINNTSGDVANILTLEVYASRIYGAGL